MTHCKVSDLQLELHGSLQLRNPGTNVVPIGDPVTYDCDVGKKLISNGYALLRPTPRPKVHDDHLNLPLDWMITRTRRAH